MSYLENTCIYCNKPYQKNGEHVFPFGLGGQDIYIDCVCSVCNNYFAGLERELYQKSFVGLLRSVHGVEGYSPNAINPSPFKAPVLLSIDKKHNLVFEIGQYAKMQVNLRPQIYFHHDRYHIEGDSQENTTLFATEFSKWIKENGILTAKVNDEIVMLKFELEKGKYKILRLNGKQATRKAIQFCSLPIDHRLYEHLKPRLFIDDDRKLKIRAKTFQEAEHFLLGLLDDIRVNNNYTSLVGIDLDTPVVEVGFSFNPLKFEQALVKIGLNCLLHYYPKSRTSPSIKPHVNFVMGNKSSSISRSKDDKEPIKDSKEGHHNVFFFQTEKNVNVRISLFNGEFAFSFWIDDLKVMDKGRYGRLLINYTDRINTFQDTNSFLL